MAIERVIVKNYRALLHADVTFGAGTNIIVGNNETGKSTLLEAINLALKCQLGRRPAAYELHPFLFSAHVAAEYVRSHAAGKPLAPPVISIELFLADKDEFAGLRGSINSLKADQPGIRLTIELDDECRGLYAAFIANSPLCGSTRRTNALLANLGNHSPLDFSDSVGGIELA